MLKDEGCCGDYYYNMGRTDLAQEKFRENAEKFERIIALTTQLEDDRSGEYQKGRQ